MANLRNYEDLPGPRGWPLLGNLPQVKASRIHRDMEAVSRLVDEGALDL